MKVFCFISGIGVGILICHPKVVTELVLDIVEKQAEAKKDLVTDMKIVEEDLQAFLKRTPKDSKQ